MGFPTIFLTQLNILRTRTTSFTTTSARLGTAGGTKFLRRLLFTVNWMWFLQGTSVRYWIGKDTNAVNRELFPWCLCLIVAHRFPFWQQFTTRETVLRIRHNGRTISRPTIIKSRLSHGRDGNQASIRSINTSTYRLANDQHEGLG